MYSKTCYDNIVQMYSIKLRWNSLTSAGSVTTQVGAILECGTLKISRQNLLRSKLHSHASVFLFAA